MFYFSGDVLLSFQLVYGGEIITPSDVNIQIYEDDTVINSGNPVLSGTTYNYVVTIEDEDIAPAYYKEYRFLVSTVYNGETVFVNGYFIVHLSDYDNYDNSVVYLSNTDSEVYLSCADETREDCLTTPPVKPKILSLEIYRNSSSACDCDSHK